jgi:hypothetical protein
VNVAEYIRSQLPEGGLFAGQQWRIATQPFAIDAKLAKELETLGRVLLQFNRAVNLLYRQSYSGKQPAWIAEWLDAAKPQWLIELQRSKALKNDVPAVIRPDILLTEDGFSITELDSVPGGIGLTGWLNRAYSSAPAASWNVLGGADGMINGFRDIFSYVFQGEGRVHVVVSEESATYRPEMEWLCARINETLSTQRSAYMEYGLERHLNEPRFAVRDGKFNDFKTGDSFYRFIELFDTENVPNAKSILEKAAGGHSLVTPPPKPIFEEKMLFALLWNRNLREFWRRELGESFFARMLKITPYTWLIDPAPLPPQGAFPELNLTDWQQLKTLSQRERALVLKISGFSPQAWGSRGVYVGSDLPGEEWASAVEMAIRSAPTNPYVLQRFQKPKTIPFDWFDFATNATITMQGRVRLCPYYFVTGLGPNERAHLGGALATVVPADKKIVHGMTDAVLAPCMEAPKTDGAA